MASTMPDRATARHLQRLETVAPAMAKADLKILEAWKAQIGGAIDAAIATANRTQKETWVALGHEDGAQLNRWIKGKERPQMDALFAIDWLRQPLVIAFARLAGDGVAVTTQITLTQRIGS